MKKLIRSSTTAIYSTQLTPKILEIWVVDDARHCSASIEAADEGAETHEEPETEKASQAKNSRTRRIEPSTDIAEFLNSMKKAPMLFIERSAKNSAFLQLYKTLAGKLFDVSTAKEFLKQLTISDYVYTTESDSANYKGDELIVFEPVHDLVSRKNGVVLKNVVIYMKIDKTESNEDETVLVSFHSAEFEDDKPYSSVNNKKDS